MRDAWQQLVQQVSDIERLSAIQSLLHWDQQTYMPAKAGAGRGEQSALLARIRHQQTTDPQLAEWVEAVAADPEADEQRRAAVRNLKRTLTRATALPVELVERLARLENDGFNAWVEAREAADWSRFAPILTEILHAVRERAACIDNAKAPYDVILEDYDPGTTSAELTPLFARLRGGLTELLEAIAEREPPPADPVALPPDVQLRWHRDLVHGIGYDLQAGRIDLAAHPFTISPGAADVRITTRINPDDVISGLGSTIHEVGHALYEQGLPPLPGTGLATAASMGLHESQSRFWENVVGRSLPFLGWASEQLGRHVADPPTADRLYRLANRVRPGLIRVDADEVTYNLHIIVRFELEQALFRGDLAVADLPDAWNERYEALLGVRPANPAEGVLQDVHWSGGAFGYFPSYTLGNLYAASLAAVMLEHLPDLWEKVGRGEFEPILSWLRAHVHGHGHRYDTPELIARVVGPRDHVDDLLGYLWGRHGALYGLSRPR